MFHNVKRMTGLLLLGMASIAMADAPSTQPAPDAAQVFRTFLLDIESGKAAVLPAICSAHDADSRALIRDFQSVASSMDELRKVATAKFGADAAESILPALPSAGDLEDVSETVTGDRAQIEGPDVWPVQMVRTGGIWKLDVDWLIHSDSMTQNVRWFGAMAQAMHKTAADISAGRLATADAATEAMSAREQAIPDISSTTEPATQP
jgi:hypothetical protein